MQQQRATKQMNIRLTPDQYDILKKSGEVFELSPSAFLKKLAIETKPVKPPKQPKVSKLQWREFMQEYLHQGNNLNQFTKSMNLYLKYLNPDDRKAVENNWAKLNHELKDLREQIWQSLVK